MKARILSALALMAIAMSPTHDAQAQTTTSATASGTNSVSTTGDGIVPVVALEGVPLRDAITALAKQANLSVVFAPALLGQHAPEVNEKWSNVTPREALQALLDNYGWQMTQSAGSVVHIDVRDPQAPPPGTVVNLLKNAPTNGIAGNEVMATFAIDDVPVADAIRALAVQAGINFEFDPQLANGPVLNVRLKWVNITVRQALQALLDNHGWQITQVPGNPIYRIGTRDPNAAGPSWTIVDLAKYTSAKGAKNAGNQTLPTVVIDGALLPDAIRSLARQAELNLMIDPAVFNQKAADGTLIGSAKVDMRLQNVTVRQALQALLDKHGLQATETPDIPLIRIVAKNP